MVSLVAAIGVAVCGAAASAIDAGMPNPPAAPTLVRCGIVILDVIDIDDVNESFEAELALVATWHDAGLAFDAEAEGTPYKIFQGEYQFNELYQGWWPQFVILNEAGRGDMKAVKLTVFPDGTVRYMEQRSTTLETPMRLEDFPFDTQHLRASMVAFGTPVEQVVLEVDPNFINSTNEYVHREEDVNVAGWDLERLDMATRETLLSAGSEQYRYSCLETTVTLKRRSWQLVWQMLFPLLVIVSMIWSIFWINNESLADRLNVSFIGVLTIVAYQFVVIDNMPRMSYLTFTDALLLVSFIAMAATIPQSLVVHRLVRRGRQGRAQKIDRVCRWAFPLTYLLILAATLGWYRLT